MLTLLHGEDIVASKNKLAELKLAHKDYEVIILDGSKVSLNDILLAFETRSLFVQDKVIIIENILSGKNSRAKDERIDYIAKETEAEIIIWEGKELTPGFLKKFPKAKVLNFKLNANIFKLVENLKPGFGPKLVPLFQELIRTEAPEVIFVMFARQIRNLLLAKDTTADFLKGFPSWQKYKILGQAKYLTEKELLSLHRKLLEIDSKIKLGATPLTMTQNLDIFLLNI